MASTERRVRDGQVRWVARYRDPAGVQRSRTFARKSDAERYLTGVESTKLSGSYVDPARSRVTVGVWAAQWLDAQTHLKPSTRAGYEGIVTKHIGPRWGATPLAKVGHADVVAWVAGLDLAPASVRYVHRVLALVLELAVRDDRLPRNPAATDAGLAGLTPHELQHTAASLAVSSGANVKGVQRMLGHASAAMTLDVYSGPFDDDLDGLAERMDAAAAGVYPMCTGADVVALPRTTKEI